MKFFTKRITNVSETTAASASQIVSELHQVATETEKLFDTTFTPVRKNIFERFPITSVLAATFGVALTFFGLEQLLLRSEFFTSHPLLTFLIGVGILISTGTLYKKLG